MNVSLPSREIYSIDVPDVFDFGAEFVYNFFVPDESVNETGEISAALLAKNSSEIGTSFLQFASTRAPRFVKLEWTPVHVSSTGRRTDEMAAKNNSFFVRKYAGLIKNNLDKIVTEDNISSFNFVTVNFHDAKIDEKVHFLVSGSFEQHSLGNEIIDNNVSHERAAQRLRSLVPKNVKSSIVQRALASAEYAYGGHFYAEDDSNNSSASRSKSSRKKSKKHTRSRTKLSSKFWNRLKQVNANVQISSKFLRDMTLRMVTDPGSPYAEDARDLLDSAGTIQANARQASSLISESDYKTVFPFVGVHSTSAIAGGIAQNVVLVGYVIDKSEIIDGEPLRKMDPIVVENPHAALAVDFGVRYGATYTYAVRAIALVRVPAADIETGELAAIDVLVSSRPSSIASVTAIESEPPPPPVDLKFIWDYENEKMVVNWSFPPNSQRDIKKFQLFRRNNVDEPFELIKMYDFDDSLVRVADIEYPDPSLVEFLSSPATWYIDDDFNKDSRFIYALASLDAHGFTSGYSAQFEVSFDRFKNKSVIKLVSHSGAPKPYPNLYLATDTFVDTIKVDGGSLKKMKLYFNPEYFAMIDDENRVIPLLATNQLGGCYKLSFINIDNQKSATLVINVDDRTTPGRLGAPVASTGVYL